MDLDSVADELYGLPLDEFVSTRNARAKAARADGDRDLAAEIRQLAKPSTAAWLVNQLVREESDDVEALLEVGRELRAASAELDADQIRSLSEQRRELLNILVEAARQAGRTLGRPVSDGVATEVRQTLEASGADADVADSVAAGRMTQAVEYAGFGDLLGLGGPTGVVGKSQRPRRPAPEQPPGETSRRASQRSSVELADLTARRRARAEREAAAASERLAAAREAQEAVARERGDTSSQVEAAEGEVERLQAELSTAEQSAQAARDADDAASRRLAEAERAVAAAERDHERAAAAVAELDG